MNEKLGSASMKRGLMWCGGGGAGGGGEYTQAHNA